MPPKATNTAMDAESIPGDPVDAWHLRGNHASFMARIVNRLNIQLLERLRELDLTNQHYRVIQILYDDGILTVGQIARRIVIAQPVLSRVLSQMEERGLVERRPDPEDSRFKRIALTDKGSAIYELVWPYARDVLGNAMRALSEAEQMTLLTLLGKMDARVNP